VKKELFCNRLPEFSWDCEIFFSGEFFLECLLRLENLKLRENIYHSAAKKQKISGLPKKIENVPTECFSF
jgi:hypothetical protein